MHLCPGGISSVANCRQKTAQDELSSPYSPVKGGLCPRDRQYPSCGWKPGYKILFPAHSFPTLYLQEESFPWSSKHAVVYRRGGVRRRGCLTLGWRRLRRGSLCRSCVPSGRRCCSSPAPRWWRRPCRRRSAGRPSGSSCCRTGCDTGSSASSGLLGPEQRNHTSH